ncbi:MAG TPA: type II toxin-antitoxin system Phd/YefM family antitoxin [Polyangiaceae bacterium]
MNTITFSRARSNLKAVLDRVVEDVDVTIIKRRDASDAVVMSLERREARGARDGRPSVL